jgi:hypothetical protein
MKTIYISILILVAFVAFWFLVIVPAEKKHHQRKIDALEKRIADRETNKYGGDSAGGESADTEAVHESDPNN